MIEPDDLFRYRAKLQRVVDGDTVRLLVDLGMWIHTAVAVRVAGVDTPELFSGTDRAGGKAAKVFTEQWFSTHGHDSNFGEDWPFLIRTHKDLQSFNRYVADIECTEGHDLATAIREAGWSA